MGEDGSFTLKGVVFMDLPLIITMLRDLSAQKDIPAQVRASVYFLRSLWVPETEFDVKFKSSIKAQINGKLTLEEWMKLFASDVKEYSMITFIPDRKRMMEIVHPVKIPLKCWKSCKNTSKVLQKYL